MWKSGNQETNTGTEEENVELGKTGTEWAENEKARAWVPGPELREGMCACFASVDQR
jgi:hypothetical protein